MRKLNIRFSCNTFRILLNHITVLQLCKYAHYGYIGFIYKHLKNCYISDISENASYLYEFLKRQFESYNFCLFKKLELFLAWRERRLFTPLSLFNCYARAILYRFC